MKTRQVTSIPLKAILVSMALMYGAISVFTIHEVLGTGVNDVFKPRAKGASAPAGEKKQSKAEIWKRIVDDEPWNGDTVEKAKARTIEVMQKYNWLPGYGEDPVELMEAQAMEERAYIERKQKEIRDNPPLN